MISTNKIIGTLVPITALFSSQQANIDHGTFAAGLIFLDWLSKTGQTAWQLLPLNETQLEGTSMKSHIPSPYKSYGIGLHPQYLSSAFLQKYPTLQEKDLFLEKNQYWITDYAIFCSLRDYFQTDDWRMWDKEVRERNLEALAYWENKLANKIDFYIKQQWQIEQSYIVLRSKAKTLGITLIGDLPFYISIKSPLAWVYQNAFQIEKDGSMPTVSGIPDVNKTYFGRQIWGHPLYNWESPNTKDTILALWKIRIRYMSQLFDYIRYDHANGFFHYGCIDVNDAKKDMYKVGPGPDVFEELIDYSYQQGLNVFVEDSGESIKQLLSFMKKRNIPGVRVFSFSFPETLANINTHSAEISNYPQQTVSYTSIHDTRTLLGFLEFLDPKHKKILASVSGVLYSSNTKEFATALRAAIIQSPSQMVIIPIQDWLLTTDRINIPGTEKAIHDKNWRFRLNIPIEALPVMS
ncbi:MAG: 4-alpha-glucanotransferase [Candidatus Levyibacteriota bacterium]